MKKLLCLAYLLLCVLPATVLLAQNTDVPIISVLDFQASGISEAETRILIDYISSYIVESGKYTVIDRMQRESILEEIEFSFSVSDCVDEACQIELGKLLSANQIVVGSLGRIGGRYLLNIKLIQVETGKTLKTASGKYNSIDELVDNSKELTLILIGESVQIGDEEVVEEETTDKLAESSQAKGTIPPITYTPRKGLSSYEYYTFDDIRYYLKSLRGAAPLLKEVETTDWISLQLREDIQRELRSIKTGQTIYWSGVTAGVIGLIIMFIPLFDFDEPQPTKEELRKDIRIWLGAGIGLGGSAIAIIGGAKIMKRPESIIKRFNDELSRHQAERNSM